MVSGWIQMVSQTQHRPFPKGGGLCWFLEGNLPKQSSIEDEDEETTVGHLCQALQAKNGIWLEGLDTTGITNQIDNLYVNYTNIIFLLHQ